MNRFKFKKLLAGACKNGGSTIVGVMAALVFIGIVTGFMVKNTGAQSAASAGYGSVMTMQSTAASGVVATEGFFSNDSAKGLAFIDTIVRFGGGDKFVFSGTAANQRRRLSSSSNQYFSSKKTGQIQNNLTASGGDLKAGFQVAAGKNAKGKALKTAMAFYQFENLKREVVAGSVGAKNAMYSQKGITNADAGLTIDSGGGATFMSYAKFQNAAAVFDQTAYFGGGAYFMKDSARFKDKAYFVDTLTKTEFHVKAIFDSVVIFKGPVQFLSSATFKQGAYFLKGVSFTNGTASFNGTAYFSDSASFASNNPATFQQRAYFTGKVRFEATATFQNSASAYFGGDAVFASSALFNSVVQFDGKPTFNGNVTFEKWVYFGANVVFGSAGTFRGETYFGNTVTLGGSNLNFYHRVGFEGNVFLNGKVIKSNMDADGNKYDVSIGGKITDQWRDQGKIEGILQSLPATGSKAHDVYYTSNFGNLYPANWNALDVFNNFANKKLDTETTVWRRFTYINKDSLKTPIPTIPLVPADSARRDPQLSIQQIYNADTAHGGNVVILNAIQAMTTNGSTFDMVKLRQTYTNANRSTFYNGTHLVIEITSSITVNNSVANEFFDANIIYIIKAGGTLNAGGGNFYSNTDSATTSTLIYVGSGNATLQQFGTKNTFRGFIYIDSLNNATTNSIHFSTGGKAKIIGAVHNFSRTSGFEWNTGSSGYSTPIEFNTSVLGAFASLYPSVGGGTPSSNDNVTLRNNSHGIDVKPLGVYFY
ncbi:MAG: hypothetical protein LBB74_01575 [Chitinispirillales bacterium]|jgi:hypothetical protein|nr:hypothetical protein [Chitinispirillales bacterium]